MVKDLEIINEKFDLALSFAEIVFIWSIFSGNRKFIIPQITILTVRVGLLIKYQLKRFFNKKRD